MLPFIAWIALAASSSLSHLYEGETPRQPRLAIPDDIDVLDLSVHSEELPKLRLGYLRIQIPHKNTLHALVQLGTQASASLIEETDPRGGAPRLLHFLNLSAWNFPPTT